MKVDTLTRGMFRAIELIFCIDKRLAFSKLIPERFAQQIKHEAVISDGREEKIAK
jgi:hypothetical protein